MWYTRGCPSGYGWIALIGLILYIIFFSPGMRTIPWIRDFGLSTKVSRYLRRACIYGYSGLKSYCFSILPILDASHCDSIYIYVIWIHCVAAIIFVIVYDPKSKAKALVEKQPKFYVADNVTEPLINKLKPKPFDGIHEIYKCKSSIKFGCGTLRRY